MIEIMSSNEKCNYCMWQIYEKYYGVVGCKAVDEKCPTFDDVFTAKHKGIYAYFGLYDEVMEEVE